ncbi:3-oxoadipate enol-lactonase 2 [Pigmentiphaga humi]|uniref:3-oxoadipate enol-lactonase 2 n=1 Tax=Pigmentiphaga humi TaxID=2478468 RepID=A0A3P4B0K0_9BURK|nr:alpha/beta fold hydrolase [Pigmentiphaga humi]VCU69819.1 3-oxoadipate enol-lactonase 2 [Pigmentiphaga humi]
MSGRTRIERSGTGPQVVLIHGVGLDLRMWDALEREIGGRCELVRYDMLGHGGTPLEAHEPDLDCYVEQLGKVLDAEGLSRPCIVGYSMGGLVAGRFAALHPERVDRLVLMSTVFRRSEEERQAVRARLRQAESGHAAANAEVSLARWFSPEFAAAHPAAVAVVRHRLLSNRREDFLAAYRVFATADEALPQAASAIRCPTLVMTGEQDSGSTARMARELSQAVAHAALHIEPGQKHMLPVEAARAVAGMLARFAGADEAAQPLRA